MGTERARDVLAAIEQLQIIESGAGLADEAARRERRVDASHIGRESADKGGRKEVFERVLGHAPSAHLKVGPTSLLLRLQSTAELVGERSERLGLRRIHPFGIFADLVSLARVLDRLRTETDPAP